jgi:adenylylsulfate kinase
MGMIIVVCGLPGSGKTSLSEEICERTNAITLNADKVRNDLSKDLTFSLEDRVEQARRLGAISRLFAEQGQIVVADFVNPTDQTREAFGKADCFVWVNRISSGRFADTNSLWQDPKSFDIEIPAGISVEEEATLVLEHCNIYDWKKPTTLMLGRYQPWHEGHEALKKEAHKRTKQVLIGVRSTHGTSEKDPLSYEQVEEYILGSIDENSGLVMKMPNITNIVYGRDVGYKIEHIDLPPEIRAISATKKRKEMGI